MNILHVIPSFAPAWRYGGPISAAYGMTRALVRSGHEVTVFTTNLDGAGVLDVPIAKPVDVDGVETWYFPVQWPRWYYYSRELNRQLINHAADFDVVHIHSIFLWPTTAAARACRNAGVPYVSRPAGMLQADHLSTSYLSNARSLTSRLKKQLYLKTVGKSDINGAAALHFTSKSELDSSNPGKYDTRKFVASLGVDLPSVNHTSSDSVLKKQSIRSEKQVILFLSRLDRVKGLDVLAYAMERLLHRDDWVLVVAGEGTSAYRQVLENDFAQRGLTQRVEFTGMVVGEKKGETLSNADIFVLPSYQDSFGVSAVEAMATGLPVVVSDQVGVSDSITSSGAGLVVPLKADALAASIETLLEDKQLQYQMGQSGRVLAEREFSWDAVIDRTIEMYQELTSDHIEETVSKVTL